MRLFCFCPRPVLHFGYCRCLRLPVYPCVCVNPELVRPITHNPSNLFQIYIYIYFFYFFLFIYLFIYFFFFWGGGQLTFIFKVKCILKIQNHLIHNLTQHPFTLGSPKWDQMCNIPWSGSLLLSRMIYVDLQGQRNT